MAGKEFVPEPRGGCSWTLESRKETSGSGHVGGAERPATELAGKGWPVRNCLGAGTACLLNIFC